MKKIHLDIDSLKVDSFSTTKEDQPVRGTVQAHSAYPCTVYDSCDVTACGCPGGGSGHNTCGNTSPCTPGYTLYETCDSCQRTWCE